MGGLINNVLNILIAKRTLVLGIFGSIILCSLGVGFLYQFKMDKEREARNLFDEAWQQMTTVVQSTQNNSKQKLTKEQDQQIRMLYTEAVNTINLLVSEYSETVGGAQAALLIVSLESLSKTLFLNESADSLLLNKDQYFVVIKKKHPKFWGAAIAFVQGIQAEQEGNVNAAIDFYKEVLSIDKRKYIADHAVMAIARNYEIVNQYEEAKEYYQKIEQEYPQSLWLSISIAKKYLLSNKSAVDGI